MSLPIGQAAGLLLSLGVHNTSLLLSGESIVRVKLASARPYRIAAGAYRKWSRELSQTPWSIAGRPTLDRYNNSLLVHRIPITRYHISGEQID